MTNDNKQLYAFLITLGIIFTLYATYALLSYNFQITLISVTLGFSLLGIGLHNNSDEINVSPQI